MAKRAFDPGKTRTFAIAGHRSTGKTSFAEVLLATTGVTRQVGRVDERTSLLDSGPSERRRGMTLGAGFAWLEWRDHLLELVDTPGSEGVAHERSLALAGVDAVVLVVGGTDGVEYGTERVFEEARRLGLPVLFVINKMDRTGDPGPVLADLRALCPGSVLPLQLPFRDDEGQFSGVVSLLGAQGGDEGPRVLRYDLAGSGRYSPEPVPRRYQEAVAVAAEQLSERIALSDDTLLEAYMEYLELSPEQSRRGLAAAVQRGEIHPVVYASAAGVIGAHAVLDAVVDLLPSPLERPPLTARDAAGTPVPVAPEGPFTAQILATRLDREGNPYHVLRVWSGTAPRSGDWIEGATGARARVRKLYQIRGPRRTTAATLGAGALLATWSPLPGRPGSTFCTDGRRVLPAPSLGAPMMSYLIQPVTSHDEAALEAALETLVRLDAALEISRDPLTGGHVLAGQGQMHLDHALEVLRERLGVGVEASLPPVPYRETPTQPVRRARGVYRRSNGGGSLAYGECWIDLLPGAPQEELQFENHADDFSLPSRFVPSIDEGVREASRHGPTAGYPVIGVGVRCVGGEVDVLFSEETHLREAAARALRAALEKSGTELLEPWSTVRVEAAAPEIGQVISEINGRRGRILDLEVGTRVARFEALMPYSEVRTFAPRLQAATGGRGRFAANHSHYEKLPGGLVKEAIAASPWRSAEGDAPGEPVLGVGRVVGARPEYNL